MVPRNFGFLAACALWSASALTVTSVHASLPLPEPSAAESSRPLSVPELRSMGQRSFQPAPKHSPTEIRLSNGVVFDTDLGEPSVPARLRQAEVDGPLGRTSLLVQVEAPIQAGWIEAMESAGARVEFYVPNYAFLVRLDARDREGVESLPFVIWTGDYHPAYRISGQAPMAMRSGRGEYTVLLFGDGDVSAVRGHVAFLGGQTQVASDNGINRILTVDLDRGRMEDLAAHADVQWIEPKEYFSVGNDQVQWVDQTNILNNRKIWDNGVDGTGQVVMVGDSGIRTSHNMFRDNAVPITNFGDYPTHRKVIAYQRAMQSFGILFGDAAGAAYHGTHTSGTFAGWDDPVGGGSTRDGIARGAKIYFLDAGGATNTITAPTDLNDYFGPSYDGNAGGAARVSSNSWGSPAGGAYTVSSMTADQFAWSHKDYLICFSNGNSGTTNSVGSPATAKSILSSGGTQNGSNSNQLYGSTSRGPTDDGRLKPTVCSPGQGVFSASGSSDAAFQSLSGTSMSCPNLAASATLARQYFEDGFYPTGSAAPANGFEPSASLLKAMMVNSGVDNFASFAIPDNNIGWGRILLDNVMFFPGDTRRTVVIDEHDGVATGEAREYEIYVASASEDLKITLVWTDVASTPSASINLVNDIDLVVEQGASTYLGNVWSGGQSITGGTADALNVEENVRRATPVVGSYTIRVEGANVPFGPQPYAIVVSGGLGGDVGALTIDASVYAPGENIDIRVEDTDAGGSVTVQIQSSTETTAENFVIAGANGVYEGSFPLSLQLPAADGQLSVSDGDLITVSYTNPSPLQTLNATATVLADDPEITNVGADPTDITAIVSWDTDRPSDSQVEFGTTPALGSFSTLDPSLVTSHSHTVTGLQPETTYYFDVLSRGHEGNIVRDDFGGMHYRFTTGKRADVLLVLAETSDITEPEKYDNAFATTGWTYNTWTKPQAIVTEVGDSNSGLRSYKAVWWQVGLEQYPPFSNSQRDSITAYHDGGARIAFVSHDVAWAFSDFASEFRNAVREQWFNDTMHSDWQQDPTTWSQVSGIAADPISGAYTGGLSYTPHRAGAAGDEVNLIHGTGTASYIWRNNDVSPDDIGVKWVNGVSNGTNGVGVWGGTPTHTVSMFLEWLGLNNASSNDPSRADILDKTIQWLIGGDHPDATVTSPNGGEVFVSSPVSISWTASTDVGNGRNLAATRLEYSDDGGQSWTLISASPGSSPFAWNVSSLSTGTQYKVRVVVADDGTPELCGVDESNAVFTIAIPGNENRGPVVIAGSPGITPNPIVPPTPTTFTATITDALTGGSNVVAAEWSAGGAPAPAGSGTAMTGAFGAVQVAVSANIDSNTLPVGATSLWVRGLDGAGNWGAAMELPVQVNGAATSVTFGEAPVTQFAVHQNFPNPFTAGTSISFALPNPASVSLDVYNVQGRLVRNLHDGVVPAGRHSITWDGRDAEGQRVSSGVYFYRVETETDRAERKMVILK